ncbi:PLP-dependent aminotransferase family protein [Paenibacillus hodogayensis]|uniref:PLP-dependent aminotransferase family protein n=1 Tax=Paenibacillus hodogayensis TaxID=279208 RepID=A0ABV5VXP3_9BACL
MHKYMRLLNELERQIREGTYKEGDKLPSVRELAVRYGCNVGTVVRALNELEKQHEVYAVAKSGYYVVKQEAGGETAKPEQLDFIASAPDPDMFPYLDFRHCINKAIDTYRNELFVYGTAKGLPSLMPAVRKHLTDHQVFVPESRIFITSGVQQALSVLASIPFPNGKRTILIEQPGYHLFVEQLETLGLPAVGIRRTAAGIDTDELERLFRTGDIKFFYTMSRFHSPLGSSYSEAQKKKIARLAARYDVYIVEDDYLADLETNAKSDPIYAYDEDAKVIYLKSYSKIIFPGLRIGVAVLPEPLAGPFARHKKLVDIDSSMLSQAALEIYLKSGMFERHRDKIRALCDKRARLLASAVSRYAATGEMAFRFPAPEPPAIHTHLVLDPRIAVGPLASRLKKRGILVEPIDKHYMTGFPRERILKLNASNVKESDIDRGVGAIMEEIERGLRL